MQCLHLSRDASQWLSVFLSPGRDRRWAGDTAFTTGLGAARPRTVAPRPPTVVTSPRTVAARPPTVAPRPRTVAARPPTVATCPPTVAARPLTVAARPPTVAARPLTVAARPPAVVPRPRTVAAVERWAIVSSRGGILARPRLAPPDRSLTGEPRYSGLNFPPGLQLPVRVGIHIGREGEQDLGEIRACNRVGLTPKLRFSYASFGLEVRCRHWNFLRNVQFGLKVNAVEY